MRNGSRVFLIDSNVLVYAYDPADRKKQERAGLVLQSLGETESGALSTQVLGEFFVTVTKKIAFPLTPAEAERSLTNYVRSWMVYDLTAVIAMEAIRGLQRYQLSYWDSLIWATAKMNHVSNVLSEDFADGVLLEGVRFLNPFSKDFRVERLRTRT